jgi:hypothetical protein
MTDFDFLNGSFDIAHRQLRNPLTGSDEWDEYATTSTARTHFDGAVSIDETWFPNKGSYGMSIRLYDRSAKEWTVYWVNSRTGVLQPPVRGRFEDGLIGEDTHDGRPVLASYRWSDVTEQTAHWEQAFSTDGGRTWETNWIMDLTRRSSEPPAPDAPKVTGDFDFWTGPWKGHNRRLRNPLTGSDEWYEVPSSSMAWTYFNGAVSVDVIEFPTMGFRGMTIRLYDPVEKLWSIYWLRDDADDGVLESPVRGRFDADGNGFFHASDTFDGKPIEVRYHWNRNVPTWEQSFSVDGGQTWESNWTMTFTRP